MKLLKAFVRTTRIDEVVRALEAAGAPGITISRVHGVGPITAPFGVWLGLAARRPWESLSAVAASFHLQELYFGFSYLALAQAGSDPSASDRGSNATPLKEVAP